jgi:hypothetical protein
MAEWDAAPIDRPLQRFGVRCLFQHGDGLYEERITLWLARDEAHAFELAEAEARTYCEGLDDARYLHSAQSYRLDDDPSQQGAEVFSLMRDSALAPADYIDRFFDTGDEHEDPL